MKNRRKIRLPSTAFLILMSCPTLIIFWWIKGFIFGPTHPPGYDRLIEAIDAQSPGLVKALLESGINPNSFPSSEAARIAEEDITPLNEAIERGSVPVIQIILNHGADPNIGDGWHGSPLGFAASKGRNDIISTLLQSGAKINDSEEGSLALWYAAVNGQKESVIYLLDRGANPNTRSSNDSLLHVLETDFPYPYIAKILRTRIAMVPLKSEELSRAPKR